MSYCHNANEKVNTMNKNVGAIRQNNVKGHNAVQTRFAAIKGVF